MVRMNAVSENCEMEMMMVEYFTASRLAYSGTLTKSLRKASP
ncbi:hypothetical protein RLIN73S_07234 [Rhodanobacter lindaniclasticus]